jgi:hypothetical protein
VLQDRERGHHGGLQRAGQDNPRRADEAGVEPDQRCDQRSVTCGGQHPGGDAGLGRFGHEEDDVGVGVVAQGPDRREGHPAADILGQVSPAEAENLAHAYAPTVEQGHGFLCPGASSRHDTDPAMTHHVGKPQANSSQHRCAGTRSHDEKTLSPRVVLEPNLLLQ